MLPTVAVLALALTACDSHTCPDPELAEGTWVPSGGTTDYESSVAVSEAEFFVYDHLPNQLLVLDPLTGERTAESSELPVQLGPSGLAVTAELAFVVSGSEGQEYLPVAQLWDRASDTWMELVLPEYAPPGQGYQVFWTEGVFAMLGAKDRQNQWLGGGAVFDLASLEWQPLFAGPDVPQTLGRAIATNHGLFWWAAREVDGTGEAWLFTVAAGWKSFSMTGGPTSTIYHVLTTDGDRVWLSGGWQGSTAVMELWEVEIAEESWTRIEAPSSTRLGGAIWAMERLFMFPQDCGAITTYQPDTEEWGVAPAVPGNGGRGGMFAVAGHLVSYGKIGDGWSNGQMFRLDF